jgi:hypothetical protein
MLCMITVSSIYLNLTASILVHLLQVDAKVTRHPS